MIRDFTLLKRSTDGKAERWSYRDYEFVIEHEYGQWWCHGGASNYSVDRVGTCEGLGLAICRDDGFGSFMRRSILRKLGRAIDGTIRTELARQEVDG